MELEITYKCATCGETANVSAQLAGFNLMSTDGWEFTCAKHRRLAKYHYSKRHRKNPPKFNDEYGCWEDEYPS